MSTQSWKMHFGILATAFATAAVLVLFAALTSSSLLRLEFKEGTGVVGECFEGNGFILDEKLKGNFMSQDVCRLKCNSYAIHSPKVFGLNAGTCVCGDKRKDVADKVKLVDMSKCMVSCPGDPLQACGSANNTLLMTVEDTRRVLMPDDAVNDTFKYTRVGCYMGQPVGFPAGEHEHMSHSYCALMCLKIKSPSGDTYKYFALKDGNKCFCGLFINPSPSFPLLDPKYNFCKKFCGGSVTEHCGTDRAMLVFKFGVPSVSANGSASVSTVSADAHTTKPDKDKNCSKRCCSGSCLHWCVGILAMLIFQWNN